MQYTVTYVNGERVGREESLLISAYPTNEIVSDRVGPNTFIDADGNVREAYYIDVRATCYYVGGTTASGLPADESVIAVDPSVISLRNEGCTSPARTVIFRRTHSRRYGRKHHREHNRRVYRPEQPVRCQLRMARHESLHSEISESAGHGIRESAVLRYVSPHFVTRRSVHRATVYRTVKCGAARSPTPVQLRPHHENAKIPRRVGARSAVCPP